MRRLQDIGFDLRQARERQGLPAAHVCRNLGLDPRRQSDLELGRRRVAPHHINLVQQALHGSASTSDPGLLAAPRGRRRREAEREFLRSLRVPSEDYDPPKDRHAGVREQAAFRNCPGLAEKLRSAYLARADLDHVLGYLECVSLGSYLEYLVVAEELGSGKPLRISPHELGWSHYALVDPTTLNAVGDRRWPALGHRGGWGWLVTFRQASIRTPQRIWTPDILAYVRLRGQPPRWRLVEVDGNGHDPRWSIPRQKQIALPLLSLDTRTIERGECWAVIREFLGIP